MNQTGPRSDSQQSPPASGESLEELTDRTAETLADARKTVDRARATLHDQLLPTAQGAVELDDENRKAAPETSAGSDRDPDWLGQAIDLARDNVEAGGWPFGAVIVLDGASVATGVNEVLAKGDPTAHAEVMAIREACRVLKDINLNGAVLYASCEPCPMCLAAMRWAGLTEIVYAADREAAARAGFQDQELHDLFQRPRDTWPMTVRQQTHDLAEDPLSEWRSRNQTD